MTDRNGYNLSIMGTEDGVCFICGRQPDTARHEVFYGPNRQASKREGLWIAVCPDCHRKIHANPEGFQLLKVTGQRAFEVLRPRGEFVRIFGRNYLDEEEPNEEGKTQENAKWKV